MKKMTKNSKNLGKRDRNLYASELKLWEKVVGDIEKLNPQSSNYYEKEDENLVKSVKLKTNHNLKQPRSSDLPKKLRKENIEITTANKPDLHVGKAIGIDRRTGLRLKRGQIPVENRLDLHGHSQVQAYDALCRFVESSRKSSMRCVLVITGKGSVREETGVIRKMLPFWINQSAIRSHVLAIDKAQPKDGGSGAFYLFLRRVK